jgi:hypothetical protein
MCDFLLNHTHERPPVQGEPAFSVRAADNRGLYMSDYGAAVLRPWTDVQSVHALSRAPAPALPPPGASSLALVITFSDARVALVSDDEAHWFSLALALRQGLSGVPTYTEWSMRLRAAPHETLQLF